MAKQFNPADNNDENNLENNIVMNFINNIFNQSSTQSIYLAIGIVGIGLVYIFISLFGGNDENQPKKGNKYGNFKGKGHKGNKITLEVSQDRHGDEMGIFEGDDHTKNTVRVKDDVMENSREGFEENTENEKKAQPGSGSKIGNFSGKKHSNNKTDIKVSKGSEGDEIGIFKGEEHTDNTVELQQKNININVEEPEKMDLK